MPTPTASWIADARGELAFFAGFHDGDGCVEATVGVCIHQATTNRRVLDRLVAVFGGSIRTKSENKRGNRAPSLTWRLRVYESVAYAKAIAPYSLQSRKRKELELMAAYRDSGISRADFSTRIKSTRQTPDDEIDIDAVRTRMTERQIDAYFAGFVLADGSVGMKDGKTVTRMNICQKSGNGAILRFAKLYFECGNINHSETRHGDVWELYKESKKLAARLAPFLPPGSSKREMVEIIRDVTAENSAASRARLTELAGDKPSALSRKKSAQGCIWKVFRKDMHVGYNVRFLGESRKFSSSKHALDENLALAEAWRVEKSHERDARLSTYTTM